MTERSRHEPWTMPGPLYLRDDVVGLHTVESDDYGFIHRYWNDPTIRPWFHRRVPESREIIHFLMKHQGYDWYQEIRVMSLSTFTSDEEARAKLDAVIEELETFRLEFEG